MIKLETHAHCLKGSRCASVPAEVLVSEYLKEGYGGLVITNHYSHSSFSSYPGDGKKEKLDFYFSLVNNLKTIGERENFRIYFGSEISAYSPDGCFSEYMLYGFTEAFLYDSPLLYTLTQKELFELADKNGLMLYQTHPFRNGVTVGNPRFMHGAESFNGHIGHTENNELAESFCNKYSLIKMSGTDFHDSGQPITGGIFIPDNLADERALTDYIRNNSVKLFCDETKLFLNQQKD